MDAESIKKLTEDAALELHNSIQALAKQARRQRLTAIEAKRELTILVDNVGFHVDISTPGGQAVLLKVIAKAMSKKGSSYPASLSEGFDEQGGNDRGDW